MKRSGKYLKYLGMLLPLMLALVCLFDVSLKSSQAALPVPRPMAFIGEYSYDGQTWLPLGDEADLSARRGDLRLRGNFGMDIAPGSHIRYYRNHIGVTVFINGQLISIDAVTETAGMGTRLFASMCGQVWSGFTSPGIAAGDEVEIHLYNPHRLGNESAYRDFLNTLCGDDLTTNLLEKKLESYCEPFRIAGSVCTIASLMLLGAAFAAVITGIPGSGRLLKLALLTLFSGGFFIFDTLDASFRYELVALNTYGRHLCMMLAVFFIGHFVLGGLTGRKRRAAEIALGASAALDSALIAASLAGWTAIYDTLPLWLISQLLLCPLLMVFCAMELRRAPRGARLVPVSGLLMFACILTDIFSAREALIWRNPCCKVLFALLFAVYLVNAARSIVTNHRAGMRAARLERELEDSRIAIMLSQIQPHFLYNVLGTIRGLCREDPMQARQALEDFSDYLRGNMNALANSRMIHFTREFRHIEAYLRLEKMRMGEKLNILYDIREKDFFIPPLTIQPLVENAVKHGLFEKGCGTLILHTKREGDRIMISVQDDGVGFDEGAPMKQDDRHTHIGLANVRSRLEKMSDGQLLIDSAPGRGTTATVWIRDGHNMNGDDNSNEYSGH